MKLQTGDSLLQLVEGCEQWRVMVKGALPKTIADENVVLWCKVPTLEDVKGIMSGEMINRGKAFTRAHGIAALIQASYEIDVKDCTRTEYVEDDIRLLFESVDAVLELGEPTQRGTTTSSLLVTLLEASGYDAIEDEKPAVGALALIDKISKGRGRIISPPMLAKDGEPVEVYITRTTEAHTEAARLASEVRLIEGITEENLAMWCASILSHTVLSERGGSILLTAEQALKLPFGLARMLESVSLNMTLTGDQQATVKMFRDIKPVPQTEG